MKIAIAAASLALASALVPAGSASAAISCVEILDHRGDETPYSENTLPAYESSFSQGFSVETDMARDASGGYVMVHDRSLARISNGTGYVDERTTTYIRSLTTDTGEPAQIPLVSEAFDLLNNYPAATMLIEIKPWGGWSVRQLQNLDAVATQYQVQDQVIWWSTNHTFLEKVESAMGADTTTAWKTSGLPSAAVVDPVDYVAVTPNVLTAAYIDSMHNSGTLVLARGTRPDEVAKMSTMGADLALTSDAERVPGC